jgi:NAD-dependent histone deacetylase SIR2
MIFKAVSSGIPDFRSKNGLYQMLKATHEHDLDDPQQMFDLEFFKENPKVF